MGKSLKKRYAVCYRGWTPVRGVTIDGVYRVYQARTYRILEGWRGPNSVSHQQRKNAGTISMKIQNLIR